MYFHTRSFSGHSPDSAREADLGVAEGRANGMIYREGKAIRRVKEHEIVPALLEEINRFIADKEAGTNTAPPEIVPEPEPAGTPNSLVTLQ